MKKGEWIVLKTILSRFGLSTPLSRPRPSFDEIYRAVLAEEPALFLFARETLGSMSVDTWWRLCEGRWTDGVRRSLPELTDAGLLEFVKAYRHGTANLPENHNALLSAACEEQDKKSPSYMTPEQRREQRRRRESEDW